MVVGPVIGLTVLLVLATNSLAPFFVRGPAAFTPENEFRDRLESEVPRILDHYRVPGVVLATVIKGAPARVYAFGMADVAHHRPMKVDTIFQVASISKSLTAWGVLTLVDQGKVSLDEPAQDALRAWPAPPSAFPARAVTIRHLLTHRSGFNAGDDEFRRPEEPPASPAALLAREGPVVRGRPTPAALVAPAGGQFVYSVPGFTTLQMIIENQTGRPFAAYMKDAVLEPLGMSTSGFLWDPTLRERTATGYLKEDLPADLLVAQDLAADGLYSTAGDLARFIAAPMADDRLPAGAGVIRPESAGQLFLRPSAAGRQPLIVVGPDSPCLGCFIEHGEGGPVMVTNGGNDPGWSAQVYTVPATGDGLVILTNSSNGQPVIAQIAAMWADWRGIPAPQTTRTYRTLGSYIVLVPGVVWFFALTGGVALLNGLVSGSRRFLAFAPVTLFQSLAEGAVAATLVSVWVAMRQIIEMLPIFALVSKSAIGLLVAVVLARALFPRARGPGVAA